MAELKTSLLFQILDRATAPARQIAGAVAGVVTQTTRLEKVTGRANKILGAQQKHLTANAAAMGRLRTAEEKYQKASITGATSMFMGGQVSSVGNKILQPLKDSVKVAAVFAATMSNVGALSGASADELAMLRGEAKRLGSETFFSASEVGEGQGFLAMAGFTPKAIQEAQRGILDMALAGREEMGRAADIGSNILSGFQLEASEMNRVSDVLTRTFTTSNTTLAMLGETMSYAAPMAASLSVSLEETATMAGLLGNVGIQGSRAGTAMNAGLAKLVAARKMGAQWMEELNIEAKDAQGNFRGIIPILEDVAKATEKMGNADRGEAMARIFGLEAAPAFLTLVEKAGSKGIASYLAKVSDSDGVAKRIAEIIANNAVGDWKALSSAVEGFQISLGDLLLPVVRRVTQGLRALTRGMNWFVDTFPFLSKVVAYSVAGLGGFLVVSGGIVTTVGMVIGMLALMHYGLAFLGVQLTLATVRMSWFAITTRLAGRSLKGFALASLVSMKGLVGWVGRLGPMLMGLASTYLPAVVAGISSVSAAIFAIPGIGWLIGAIVAGIVLLLAFVKPLKLFWVGFAEGFKAAVAPMMPMLSDLMSKFEGIWIVAKWVGRGIAAAFKWVLDILVPSAAAANGWTKFGQIVGVVIGSIVRLVGGVLSAINGAITYIGEVGAMFAGWISPLEVVVRMLDRILGFFGAVKPLGKLFGYEEKDEKKEAKKDKEEQEEKKANRRRRAAGGTRRNGKVGGSRLKNTAGAALAGAALMGAPAGAPGMPVDDRPLAVRSVMMPVMPLSTGSGQALSTALSTGSGRGSSMGERLASSTGSGQALSTGSGRVAPMGERLGAKPLDVFVVGMRSGLGGLGGGRGTSGQAEFKPFSFLDTLFGLGINERALAPAPIFKGVEDAEGLVSTASVAPSSEREPIRPLGVERGGDTISMPITITIQAAAGMDVNELTKKIRAEIEGAARLAARKIQAARRGVLHDG